VIGCHRSGTNLLYDTLLSAGGFAVYRGYLPVHKLLIPRFGNLDKIENRRNAVEVWLRSKGFRRSGLDARWVREKILAQCKNGGDFIRIIMDEIARLQQVQRWAVYDPDVVLHFPRIKAEIPDAIFVHIVRDGRDIALSLMKMEGFRPFPWDRRQRSLLETGLYWEWTVRRGRSYGRQVPSDYIEVHYEELVCDPCSVLGKLGEFIEHDLDYERIQGTALGRIRESNSSFRDDGKEIQVNPINRWKEKLMAHEIADLEALIGDCLQEFDYPLTTPVDDRRGSVRDWCLRSVYPSLLDTKLFLKIKTPFGRLADLSVLELDSTD
jgi:LPS sulfotransferase NodH